jgi:hypothetical protein
LTGEALFTDKKIEEDFFCTQGKFSSLPFEPLVLKEGVQSFNNGGYYLCRNSRFFTFIRCGDHKDRPAQADNLHIDIWYQGINLLRDSGTYKYNANGNLVDYFMGSQSHNVVTVDNRSQMLKGGHFIWFYWSQKVKAEWRETNSCFIFIGEIRAFKFINPKATHFRQIVIDKKQPNWLVIDKLNGLGGVKKQQIWHPNSSNLIIHSEKKPKYFRSFNSDYYGVFSIGKSIFFEFDDSITTRISYSS